MNISTVTSSALVTPHATNPITFQHQALYCGSEGTITGRLVGDSADSAWPVVKGQYLYGHFTHVRVAGTDVTPIRAVKFHH